VTVPVWGFRDLDHYLTESSCSEYLDQVKVPLLGINALVRTRNTAAATTT
jgi:predicted alpha/beta-fold hydrolase